MPYPPLTLLKRLPLAVKLTPAQVDTNWTDIETGVNAQATQLAVALNPNGTLKANTVNTAAILDRNVTLAKLAFLSSFYAVDSGAANAMVITWVPALGGYVQGLVFYVKAIATNTGATTITVDALPPVNVMRFAGPTLGALTAGDIVAGNVYCLVYDGAEFLLLNPTPGSVTTGPVFIAPVLVYAFLGAIAWTQVPVGALIGVDPNAKGVILQCRSRWNSSTDGECVTEAKGSTLGTSLLLNRTGGTDAVVSMNQGIYPVEFDSAITPPRFWYRMTTTVPGVGETEIQCVGYYL